MLAGRVMLTMLFLGTAAPALAVSLPLVQERGQILRAVVGEPFSIALPAREGFRWEWVARGDRHLFDSPYRVRYAPRLTPGEAGPEVWVFPLVRPGRAQLEFRQLPETEGAEAVQASTRSVKLQVLEPYEAQQHPPDDLSGLILLP